MANSGQVSVSTGLVWLAYHNGMKHGGFSHSLHPHYHAACFSYFPLAIRENPPFLNTRPTQKNATCICVPKRICKEWQHKRHKERHKGHKIGVEPVCVKINFIKTTFLVLFFPFFSFMTSLLPDYRATILIVTRSSNTSPERSAKAKTTLHPSTFPSKHHMQLLMTSSPTTRRLPRATAIPSPAICPTPTPSDPRPPSPLWPRSIRRQPPPL